MDWMLQDWEHEAIKNEIYLYEHKKQIEIEWQQWEEEQKQKRLPAIIQVLKPTLKNETEHITRTVLGAD